MAELIADGGIPWQNGAMKLYAHPLDFSAIAEEFHISTEFPSNVISVARELDDQFAGQRRDMRDYEFVTIDPAGSMDLDQAVVITNHNDGYTVYYAIADVAAFVEFDAPRVVADESLRRGQTIYLPDQPARLHPAELSEDRASLLPDCDRPAVVWTINLDHAGEVVGVEVTRCLICSVQRFNYQEVEHDIAAGTLHPSIALLPEVGRLRAATKSRSQAINLRMPSQTVEIRDGAAELDIEERLSSMDYNSELSLLAGMCAADMMVAAATGVLRTLDAPEQSALDAFRSAAVSLGYPENCDLNEVDMSEPRSLALMREAQKLLRGADYEILGDGPAHQHAGVGGYYTHVTAPLRRLIDRYATEICLSISNNTPVPEWVTRNLESVVASMRSSSLTASAVDRACLDLTEATVLQPWVGHIFPAVVIDSSEKNNACRVFIENPPVIAACVGAAPRGKQVDVTVIEADPSTSSVRCAWPAD